MVSEFIIVIALVLVNGFFAGSEIALVMLRRSRLQELVEEGHGSAKAALVLRSEPERFLATVQVGITVVSATAAAFSGASIAERIEPAIAGIPVLAAYAEQVALGIVVAMVSYLSIVMGELVPKSLAMRAAETYGLLAARPLLALSWLARPLIWLLTKSSNALLRPFGDTTTFTETRYSPEELQLMVEEATRSGSLNPHAAEIASRALDLPDLIAADVMVPRQEVVMLERDAPFEQVKQVITDRPHTRLPVYADARDNIVGYVNIKDLATRSWRHPAPTLTDVLRPPYFVPETKRAVDLLREMQQRRAPLAIAVDGQGGLAGIVTIEDLVEELVGEIFSEHARDRELITKEPSGAIVVQGNVVVRELNREFELELPEEGDWNTIAGLYLALAGRIPAAGDRLELPNGIVLEIVDASARRIRTVRIHRPGSAAQDH